LTQRLDFIEEALDEVAFAVKRENRKPAWSSIWIALERHEGSWCLHCATWLACCRGEMVGGRQPGSNEFPPLADAPGKYVLEK
jgi:poly(3-hydroxyalkanoate) synthetase